MASNRREWSRRERESVWSFDTRYLKIKRSIIFLMAINKMAILAPPRVSPLLSAEETSALHARSTDSLRLCLDYLINFNKSPNFCLPSDPSSSSSPPSCLCLYYTFVARRPDRRKYSSIVGEGRSSDLEEKRQDGGVVNF